MDADNWTRDTPPLTRFLAVTDTGSALPRRRLLAGAAAAAAACLMPQGFGLAADGAKVPRPPLPPTSFYANFTGMTLLDQESRRVVPARFVGRTVLVNFVFTGCSTICPIQTRALMDLQQQMPADVKRRFHMLSVSIDPLGDTPEALKAFAKRMGVDLRNWTFVTGKPDEMDRLAEKLILFRPDPNAKRPDDHSTALWLIDKRGELRMRYNGNQLDVPRLLREIATV